MKLIIIDRLSLVSIFEKLLGAEYKVLVVSQLLRCPDSENPLMIDEKNVQFNFSESNDRNASDFKKFISLNLKKICDVTIATSPDIYGELLAIQITKFLGNLKIIRMRYIGLTDSLIKNSIESASPINNNLALAAHCEIGLKKFTEVEFNKIYKKKFAVDCQLNLDLISCLYFFKKKIWTAFPKSKIENFIIEPFQQIISQNFHHIHLHHTRILNYITLKNMTP